MGGIILPRVMIDIGDAPLFYLGGPIEYAPMWHDEAMEYIFQKRPQAFIATPQANIKSQALLGKVLEGPRHPQPDQRYWEKIYMAQAVDPKGKGGLIFWLPAPAEPATPNGYGKMSRLELGEAIAEIRLRREHNLGPKLRIFFGRQKGFAAIQHIEVDLETDARVRAGGGEGYDKLYDTLQETCDAALGI